MASLINFFFLIGIALISQNAYAKPPPTGKAAPSSSFTYQDPSKWGSLAPGYKLCSTGSLQSPIDIQRSKAKIVTDKQLFLHKLGTPQVFKASLIPNAVNLLLSVTGRTDVLVDSKEYRLLSLRWHTPSEHFIDGVQYDAEMHQVYVAADGSGKLVIIASLYKTGPKDEPDPIVAAIQAEIGQLSRGGEVATNKFKADLLEKIPSDKYFRYAGSKTVPPCTEQVTWFVVPTVLPMSKAQVASLQSGVAAPNKKNARPPQPLNNRVVFQVGSIKIA